MLKEMKKEEKNEKFKIKLSQYYPDLLQQNTHRMLVRIQFTIEIKIQGDQ